LKVEEFLKRFSAHPLMEDFGKKFYSQNFPVTHISNIPDSYLSIWLSSLTNNSFLPTLTVFPSEEEAHYFVSNLDQMMGTKKTIFLPSSFENKHSKLVKNSHLSQERTEALNKILHSPEKATIVTHAQALCESTPAGKSISDSVLQLSKGDELDFAFFNEYLMEYGFERVEFVYEPGQFALRGGIVDVFSFAGKEPARIELDGDIIDSIRTFDPITQLSTAKMEFIRILPEIKATIQETTSLFDYLSKKAVLFIKNFADFEGIIKDTTFQKNDEEIQEVRKVEFSRLIERAKEFNCFEMGKRYALRSGKNIEFNVKPQIDFGKNFNLFIDNLDQNKQEGIANLVFSDSGKQIERIVNIFDDKSIKAEFDPVYFGLSEGFVDLDFKISAYAEHQVFGRHYSHKYKKRFSKSAALSLRELKNLKPGDFVTHIDHGIGKFGGLERIDVKGKTQEAVRLVYKNNDLLYVNIHSLHKIAKYTGKEGNQPLLNKLGSGAWEKKKNKTKSKVKDIARELIKLYALRKKEKGFSYGEDSYLQQELEASFIYEDTPDQVKATTDVKKDMESAIPMDRLICGDVGFGKTEIAIRAAAKAVADSKQVAVLVPTTILAYQHYKNFKERLEGYPANIDYINRFKSKAEQTKTLTKLKDGKTDIIIGTHRLAGKDIKFKDLGLLVIDEEQKFGVSVKEKLKEIKVNVDSLTLTATPIPRTLHFSLMGARDLSVINTPPPNRIPITTELHVYDKETISEAINNEVARGGQVFFVHHRIKDIYEIADQLEMLCPGIKVGVGHGQLEGHELEEVMFRFVEGDFDVLVATTIIESGLDIPNANTIIINNAHMYGLSDLHQMRGRVGRSNKKAYCFLLSPPLHSLSDDAKRRLVAIEEFHDLGSGFNVAMRDLDIRGAGNLLGAEQSGFISEMGFDMYHKILDEAVSELKHEEFADLFEDEEDEFMSKDCAVETVFSAIIPVHYVSDTTERLSLYNELAEIKNEEELEKFGLQLQDRFGKTPKEVELLFQTVHLKWSGMRIGLNKILLDGNMMKLYCPSNQESPFYSSANFLSLMNFVNSHSLNASVKETSKGLVVYIKMINSIGQALHTLNRLLSTVSF
jgi:transcription-repair coupling factor (superfamily II helicase)